MTTIKLVATDGTTSTLTIPDPVVATPGGQPAEVDSYGPNGTHYPDNTPWLYGPVATVVECDCTWAAIKAARNALTPAQVAAGAWIKVRPGTLPGAGASAGSTKMMDNVGKVTDTKRVLITPRDGRLSVKFSGDVRLNNVYWTAMVGFDHRPYALTTTGCSYFAHAWSTVAARRTCGLGGMITEHVDNVEVVITDVQVGDSDPAGYGSGYDGNAGAAVTSGWLRDCLDNGCYVVPQYLPPKITAPDGTVTQGYGHNDGIQLYGSAMYSGFTYRNLMSFGSNNSAIQIGKGDVPAAGLPFVGEGPWLTLYHCLLLNATWSISTRYPLPPEATPLAATASAINDRGRPDYMDATDVIAIGSNYSATSWNVVNNCVSPAKPVPSKSGTGWKQDATLTTTINKAWVDAHVINPTDDELNRIWGPIWTLAP